MDSFSSLWPLRVEFRKKTSVSLKLCDSIYTHFGSSVTPWLQFDYLITCGIGLSRYKFKTHHFKLVSVHKCITACNQGQLMVIWLGKTAVVQKPLKLLCFQCIKQAKYCVYLMVIAIVALTETERRERLDLIFLSELLVLLYGAFLKITKSEEQRTRELVPSCHIRRCSLLLNQMGSFSFSGQTLTHSWAAADNGNYSTTAEQQSLLTVQSGRHCSILPLMCGSCKLWQNLRCV